MVTKDEDRADHEMANRLEELRFAPDQEFEARLRNRLLGQLRADAFTHPEQHHDGHSTWSSFMKSLNMKSLKMNVPNYSFTRKLAVVACSAIISAGIVLVVSPEVRAATTTVLARFVPADSPWAFLAPRQPVMPQVQQTLPHAAQSTTEVVTQATNQSAAQLTTPSMTQSQSDGSTSPTDIRTTILTPEAPAVSLENLPKPNVTPKREFLSLEQAQSKLSFTIRVPSKLPSGYSLVGVAPILDSPPERPSAPEQLSNESSLAERAATVPLPESSEGMSKLRLPQVAILVFANANGETLMLGQRHLGNDAPDMPARADIEVEIPVGKDAAQSVSVSGNAAQYVAGYWTPNGWQPDGNYQLTWSANGIAYDLVSNSLKLDQLLPVAESLN